MAGGGERVTIMSPRVRIIRTCGGGLLLALVRIIRSRRSWWSVVGWLLMGRLLMHRLLYGLLHLLLEKLVVVRVTLSGRVSPGRI